MIDGVTVIKTRAALLSYVLQALHIDISHQQRRPEAQQIVIQNVENVREYVF